MNKLTINLGLSLIFSTSLLVSNAQANTVVDPDHGYTQVVDTPDPEYKQDSTTKPKEAKQKPEENKAQVQSLTTVLAIFLGQKPSNQTSDTEDSSPSTNSETPLVQAPSSTPATNVEDATPETPAQLHAIQGVLLDITPGTIIVRYKSFQKSGTKSKSATKRSMAQMVKVQSNVQTMSFDLQRLEASDLESLDAKLFEEAKFIYEMDENGTRYVTGIK